MIWFRRTSGLNADTMREIAKAAGVSWDYQTILYQEHGIGYEEGDASDITALQDAAESILGYRLVETDVSQPDQ